MPLLGNMAENSSPPTRPKMPSLPIPFLNVSANFIKILSPSS